MPSDMTHFNDCGHVRRTASLAGWDWDVGVATYSVSPIHRELIQQSGPVVRTASRACHRAYQSWNDEIIVEKQLRLH